MQEEILRIYFNKARNSQTWHQKQERGESRRAGVSQRKACGRPAVVGGRKGSHRGTMFASPVSVARQCPERTEDAHDASGRQNQKATETRGERPRRFAHAELFGVPVAGDMRPESPRDAPTRPPEWPPRRAAAPPRARDPGAPHCAAGRTLGLSL